MPRSAVEVKQWYADTHGISVEEANSAIAYRSAFQQIFNDKVGSSQFRETFDVQAGSGAKTINFLTQLASGLTSFFGGGLIGAAGNAAVEFDKKKRAETLAGLSELKPAVESCGSRLQNFTEEMAEDFTVMSLRKLSGLDKNHAATLAREDAKLLIRQIADGKFNEQIGDSQVIGVGNSPRLSSILRGIPCRPRSVIPRLLLNRHSGIGHEAFGKPQFERAEGAA